MKPLPLILNPAAGGGRCGAQSEAAVRRLADSGIEVDVRRTNGPGHASALAQAAWLEGHTTLLVAGGDGTTYEVVNGLYPHRGSTKPRLGLLPLGTGNSFLRDFGITTADQALAAVVRGTTRSVDVIRATHTLGAVHYVNLLSIGFTSDVATTTNRWLKPLGAAGYALATVAEVARLKARPFPHRLDDGPVDVAPYVFLSFSNTRCTGGTMNMAPTADPSDGLVDVIRVGPLGRVGLLTTFPKIYAGTHLDHPLNSGSTAASVSFVPATPYDCMIDGEVVRLTLQRLDVLPQALEVFA